DGDGRIRAVAARQVPGEPGDGLECEDAALRADQVGKVFEVPAGMRADIEDDVAWINKLRIADLEQLFVVRDADSVVEPHHRTRNGACRAHLRSSLRSMPLERNERAHRHLELAQLVGAAELREIDDEAGREHLRALLAQELHRALSGAAG